MVEVAIPFAATLLLGLAVTVDVLAFGGNETKVTDACCASVFVSETELRHSLDDFVRVTVFLIQRGMEEGWIRPDRNAHETSALLLGGINQTIITWLLYRQPRNLTKAGIDIAERLLAMLELEAAQHG